MKKEAYFLLILCNCVVPLCAMEKKDPDSMLLDLIANEAKSECIEHKEEETLYHPSIVTLSEILAWNPSEEAIGKACGLINQKKEDDASMLKLIDHVEQSFECSDEYKSQIKERHEVCEKRHVVLGMMFELLQGYFKGHTLQDFRSAQENGLLLQ